MKICVWKTGHEIADTIAEAVYEGLRKYCEFVTRNQTQHENWRDNIERFDVHIAYGILRGCSEVFRDANRCGKPFFNIDRGYWKPGHYDGYYRVSLNGTQQTFGLDKIEPDYERLDAFGIDILEPKNIRSNDLALICPPTSYVESFFKIEDDWTRNKAFLWGSPKYKIRHKTSNDNDLQEDLDKCRNVITFNSSVGWEALRQGIPVVSDPYHSIIGAYQKLLDKPIHADSNERRKFFAIQCSLQRTLNEFKEGQLWPLLQNLLTLQ